MYSRADLLTPARALCTAFANGANTHTLLTHFTRDPAPTAHEHGLPGLAPFLGRTFTGVDGVSRYFQLLGEYLGVDEMRFEDESHWVVDTQTMTVVIRGEATFYATGTGDGIGHGDRQAWHERFIYRLGIATSTSTDSTLKVREYLVWADTGAAYLALHKRLGEVQQRPQTQAQTGTGTGTRRLSLGS